MACQAPSGNSLNAVLLVIKCYFHQEVIPPSRHWLRNALEPREGWCTAPSSLGSNGSFMGCNPPPLKWTTRAQKEQVLSVYLWHRRSWSENIFSPTSAWRKSKPGQGVCGWTAGRSLFPEPVLLLCCYTDSKAKEDTTEYWIFSLRENLYIFLFARNASQATVQLNEGFCIPLLQALC